LELKLHPNWHEAKATPKMMKKRRHSREGGNPAVVGLAPWSLFSFLLDSRLRGNDEVFVWVVLSR